MLSLNKPQTLTAAAELRIDVAPAWPKVLGISSSFPRHRYTQRDMLGIFGYAGHPFAEAIFERSTIATRPMVLAPEEFARNTEPYFQFAKSQEGCLAMAEQAIRQALAQAGASFEDLGCLVLATTSQLHMPSLTALLVQRMGLPRGIAQYNLLGHGCAGAVPLLTLAEGFLRSHPDRLVVAVCVEVGSVMLQPAPVEHKAAVVANSLFSDAGVALVLGAGGGTAGGPRFVDAEVLQGGEEATDSALYVMQENGCRTSLLNKALPERSAGLIGPAIETLLARHGLTRADVKHWAMHPGGRAILDKLQDVLQLTEAQVQPSRDVLRTVGNASSPTCLIVLERIAASGAAGAGDWGLVVCVGPGLIAACALVRWG